MSPSSRSAVQTVPGRRGRWIPRLPPPSACPRRRAGWATARACRRSSESLAPQNLVHVHGLWRLHYLQSAQFARARSIPVIVSVHGMLLGGALRQRAALKRVERWLFQDALLRRARCLHATSCAEAEAIRRLGFQGPIAVVPWGVHPPDASSSPPPSLASDTPSAQSDSLSGPAASDQGAGTVAARLGAGARAIRSVAPRGGRLRRGSVSIDAGSAGDGARRRPQPSHSPAPSRVRRANSCSPTRAWW